MVYNYLIGNCDAHAKNFSLLFEDGAVRLAPFYDLISTKVYGTLSPKFAMHIGGQLRGEWVAKEHWLKLADEAAVGSKAVLAICEELGKTVPAAANKLAEQFLPKYGGEEIVRQIIKHLEAMSTSMLERLKKKE